MATKPNRWKDGAAPMQPAQSRAGEPENEAEQHKHHDFDDWYSALVSFVFHFCLTMILPLLASVLKPQETLPPAVEVVQVAEMSTSADDAMAELPVGDVPELSSDSSPIPTPDLPSEALNAVEPIDIPTFDPSANNDREITEVLDRARKAAAAAKAAVAGEMNENLGGSTGGGGSGGRAGRAARWVLTFNNIRGPEHQLQQMGGLGAEIAFPERGDKYRYFTNLAGSPKSSLRDLASESRIYWVDENPSSYMPIARHLGVGSPPIMVAFLPVELEERMLKLELAENGKTEDQILQTVFECVSRGGSYDVRVVSQQLR